MARIDYHCIEKTSWLQLAARNKRLVPNRLATRKKDDDKKPCERSQQAPHTANVIADSHSFIALPASIAFPQHNAGQ